MNPLNVFKIPKKDLTALKFEVVCSSSRLKKRNDTAKETSLQQVLCPVGFRLVMYGAVWWAVLDLREEGKQRRVVGVWGRVEKRSWLETFLIYVRGRKRGAKRRACVYFDALVPSMLSKTQHNSRIRLSESQHLL